MPTLKKIVTHLLSYSHIFLIIPLFLACQPKEITTARGHVQNENWDQALPILEKAVKVHPNNAEVHFLLGKALGARARFEEMKKEFDRSLSISSRFDQEISTEIEKNWIENFNAGVKAKSRTKFELAGRLFRTAVVIDPSKREAYKELALNYLELNRAEKALQIYKKLLNKTPDDASLLIAVGNIYYRQKKFQDVVGILQRVLQSDPNHHDALANLALSYEALGKNDTALDTYQKALALNPIDKDLIFLLGVHYYKRKEFDKSIELFERVLELSPTDFAATLNIGNAYLSMAEDLRGQLRKAANGSRTLDEVQALRTQAILNYQRVIPYLEKAGEIEPNHPLLWQNLGVAYINSGEQEKGEEAFIKAGEWKTRLSGESTGESSR